MTAFGTRTTEQLGQLRRRRPATLKIRLPTPQEQNSSDESGDDSSPGSPDSPASPSSTSLPPPNVTTSLALPSTTIAAPPSPIQTSARVSAINPSQPAVTTTAIPSASRQPAITSTSSAAVTSSVAPPPIAQPITTSQSAIQPTQSTSLVRQSTTSTTVVISTSVTAVSPVFSRTVQTKFIETRSRQTQSTVSDTFHAVPKPTNIFPDPQAIESNKPPKEKTRAHETLSHGATIALEVIGSITAIAIALAIIFLLYRRIKRKRQTSKFSQEIPQPAASSPTGTTFSSPNQPAMSFAGRVTRLRNYLGTGRKASGQLVPEQEASSVVGRAQRLDLVKPELLSEKEKNGTFMKGHQRNVTQDLNMKSGYAKSHDLDYSSASSQPTDHPQQPLQAFIKRNTIGKLVPTFRAQNRASQDDEEKLISSTQQDDARTFVYDKRGPVPLVRDADGGIQPLTGWRAKVFWGTGKKKDAKTSGASGMDGSEKNDDPTLMSGGLRTSNMGLGMATTDSAQANSEKSDVPTQREAKNFVGNGGTLKNLAGLRKGDAWVERGEDRQSFVSGMLEGSRTTWGTNVWERMETERELREVRERMEGGLGGEVQLNQRESSVARYRRPVSWIKDQAERRPPLPVPKDNNGPKEDVVGQGVTSIAYESDNEGAQRRK